MMDRPTRVPLTGWYPITVFRRVTVFFLAACSCTAPQGDALAGGSPVLHQEPISQQQEVVQAGGADAGAADNNADSPNVEVKSSELQLGDVRVLKDLTYARHDGSALLCDVYLPRNQQVKGGQQLKGGQQGRLAPVGSGRPAVLLIHGGGWALGDKWSVTAYARALAERGIVAVAMNYRHAPKYKFPAQIDDVRSALVWINQQADEYEIDSKRIGMFGYSAGGHLSCMIGTLSDASWETLKNTTNWSEEDPRWEQIPKVCGVVGGGAPCDFRDLPIDNTAIAYFLGGSRRQLPDTYTAASPAAHASPGDVPTLFIHGTHDAIVPIASSRILYEAQLKVGVPSRFLALDGPGHMLTFINSETKSATIEFLTQILFPEKNAENQGPPEKQGAPEKARP